MFNIRFVFKYNHYSAAVAIRFELNSSDSVTVDFISVSSKFEIA